jgi:hypothetical protein
MGELLIGLAGVPKGTVATSTLKNMLFFRDCLKNQAAAKLESAAAFIENLRLEPVPEGEPVAGMFWKATSANLDAGINVFERGQLVTDPRLLADLRVAGVELLPVYANELEALAHRLDPSTPMQPAIGPIPHRDKKGKVRVPIAWIVLKATTLSTEGGCCRFNAGTRLEDPSLIGDLQRAGTPLEPVYARNPKGNL